MQRFLFRSGPILGLLLAACLVGSGAQAVADDVVVDQTLSSDSAISRDLERLEDFISRERWHEVATGLQSLLERSGDTFVRGPGGDWMSLRSRVEQRLRALPEEGQRVYHTLYDTEAQDLVDRAAATQDVALLIATSRRFGITNAGARANCELANLAFNRGEFVAAIRLYESLDARQRATLLRPMEKMRYAYSLRQSGRRKQAEAAAREIPGAPAGWWTKLPEPQAPAAEIRNDWPMTFGTPSGLSAAAGGEPLLSPRWSVPMANRYSVAEQVEQLRRDAVDARRAALPAMRPITAHGFAAVRTLHGVSVLDTETGEVLWEEPTSDVSPERLLSPPDFRIETEGRRRTAFPPRPPQRGGPELDQNPLTSLLFRDAVHGSLTSDGRRLFVLDHHAVLQRTAGEYPWNTRDETPDPLGRDWKSNALAAYDLPTGQLLWRVGGERRNEPFDPPLAGMFFFGPPTPSEGRLYAIGERDGEVWLIVLDGVTGQILSTQPLANPAAPIANDMARRDWACQPAIAEGVIVCPTTAGWLVAVGQQDGRLLWAYRTAPGLPPISQRRFHELSLNPQYALNVRWASTPPVIIGHRVLFTPPEMTDTDQALICLDLLNGRTLWKSPKDTEDVALAGVHGETVLLIGRNRVRGLSLNTGRQRWTIPFPDETFASGHGLVIGDDYYQPLSDGQVWVIKIANGTVSGRLQAVAGQRPLGSLAMSRGRLISVDPRQIRGFAQRAAVEEEIAARQRGNPDDLWAVVRRAEIHQLRGEDAEAVALLSGRITAATDTSGEAGPLLREGRQILETSLWRLVESNLATHHAEYELLQSLTEAGSPRRLQVAIRRALAAGEGTTAWRHLWTLRQGDTARMLEFPRLAIRSDVWIGERLRELYDSTPELRPEVDRTLQTAVEEVQEKNDAARGITLQRITMFHPQGRRLTRWLAEQAEKNGDLGAAALHWRRLSEIGDPQEARDAQLRLAGMWESAGQFGEALEVLTSVESTLTDSEADVRREVAARITSVRDRQTAAVKTSPSALPAEWSGIEFQIHATRPMDNRAAPQPLQPYPARGAFYETHAFEFLEPRTQRLRVVSHNGEEYWNLPLQSLPRPMEHSLSLLTDGLQIYCLFKGVVQSLSLADRQVRWSYPLDPRALQERLAQIAPDLPFESGMATADAFVATQGLLRTQPPAGVLAAASARSLLVQSRDELSSLDPLTGDELWTRRDIPAYANAHCDGGPIFVVPREGTEPLLLNAVDGSPLDTRRFSQAISKTIAIRGSRLILLETTPSGPLGLRRAKSRLRSQDVLTGETAWEYDLAADSHLAWLADDGLALLAPDGLLQSLDPATGVVRKLGNVPDDIMKSSRLVQLVCDRDFVFLMVDQDASRNISYFNIPSVRVNGTVLGFDRQETQGLLWQVPLKDQNLLMSHFSRLPVLVFINQIHENAGFFRSDLKVLDKRTGRELVASDELITQNQLQAFQADPLTGRLWLHAYNIRIEISPKR